jgi:hypothetical protein
MQSVYSSASIATDVLLKDGDLEPTGGLREGRPEYMLMRDIIFEAWSPGSGMAVIVPAGYVTDRFSLPGLLKSFQPSQEKWLMPALIHDWLYDVGQIPRSKADSIFSQAMAAAGAKWWHRYGAFVGVRFGGSSGFGKPTSLNRELVERARAQGFHTWGDDRDERYADLPVRLGKLRSLYKSEPYVIPSAPGSAFDPHLFFHGENGVRNSLFQPKISASEVSGCERIIDDFGSWVPEGTVEQLAYILATAYHETGRRMQPVREAYGRNDADTRARLQSAFDAGRLPWVKTPYWADGWYGRGLVQLTHRSNYAGALRDAVRDKFGADILHDPDLLINRFDISSYVLIEGMVRGDTGVADFTSDALEDHVNSEKVDYENARKVVNPGDIPTYKTIAAQAEAFELALRSANWGAKKPQKTPNPNGETP